MVKIRYEKSEILFDILSVEIRTRYDLVSSFTVRLKGKAGDYEIDIQKENYIIKIISKLKGMLSLASDNTKY